MKNKNIPKTLVTVLISLLAIYISISTLGLQYMWSDEVYSFHAAKMILQKGVPLYDSGLYYSRAYLYHRLLAFSMKIFGVNEFGSRIINIPFLIGIAVLVGLFIYDLIKDSNIKKENKFIISYCGGLAYYISNFATAMVRETRMYTFSTFFFMLAVLLFYKGLVNVSERGKVKIQKYGIEINIFCIFAGFASFYISYLTQPISVLLGLGVIIFFLIYSILTKNWSYLIIAVLITGIGLIYMHKLFNTWNILFAFKELSPDWALSFTPFYYSILTVRNLPFVLLTAPLSLYFLLKKKDIAVVYLSGIIISFWGFLSLQSAQHERYWQNVIPILIILSVYVIFLFFKEGKNRILRTILTVLIIFFSIFHVYLSIKEYSEINTYTPHSIAIQKKLQFNSLFKYLDNNLRDKDILIADFHSAYTLYEKGYNVDYLLLPDNDINIVWGNNEIYFNIPILKYSDLNSMIIKKDGYIVIRDRENFREIPGEKITEFTRPVVYKF